MSVTVTGSASAAGASVTLPAHNVGDLLVIFAYRNNSTTNTGVPSAGGTVPTWTVFTAANAGGTVAYRVCYCIATATNHTSGTWTNATHMVAAVLTGHDPTFPIGTFAQAVSTSTTLCAVPGLTPLKIDGTSALLGFATHQTVTAWSAAPAGTTQRTVENTGICLDTTDVTTSATTYNQLCTTSGSGTYLGVLLEVCSPGPRVTGSASAAATSVAFPAHAVGDLLVVWAYNNAGTTPPTKPAAAGTVPAFVSIDNNTGANGNSCQSAYFVATATTTTTGTWTGATGIAVAVIKGHDPASPIGAHAEQFGTATNSATAPAATLNNTSGSSAILEFYGDTTVTAWGTVPANYRRNTSVATQCCLNTKNASTSDGSIAQPNTAASGGYYGQTLEIIGPYQPGRALLTLTGAAPTVTAGATVTPGGAALTLTGSAPTLVNTVTPGGASASLTGSTPQLVATVTPGGAALTLTGSGPQLVNTVTPGGATLALSGAAPALPKTVTPGGASLTLTGSTPQLVNTVTPGGATLTLTGSAPTLRASLLLTPSGAALTLTGSTPTLITTIPPPSLAHQLATSLATTTEIRRKRKALQRAQTEIRLYRNNPNGTAGLLFVGRLSPFEATKYNFDAKGNVSATGMFEVRAQHWLAKWIVSVANNPAECKNIVIRVDKYGGAWRWTGLLHHWQIATRDGVDYLNASFNDDMQTIQFILAPPNPILPVDIFQFPRDWPQFGPSCWSIGVLIFLNLCRKQAEEFINDLIADLLQLVEDPFSIGQWTLAHVASLNPANWQVHVEAPDFFSDTSLWTFIASRMNTLDSVIAAALDDGQLSLSYRRYFVDEGEYKTDIFGSPLANGALMLTVKDKSQFSLGAGTFLSGTAVEGLQRSVLQWTDGFVEDTVNTVQDSETLYPDEYWQSGFLGSFAAAPALTVRDSWWQDLQSVVTYSPATASTVIVGGDNPTADAIAKLIIEAVGNLLGYFLLGGFDSLGTIAADVIMPFLVGTILAWVEWENVSRKNALGWVHLYEVYQQGAENNAWSFAALAALRGGFNATQSQTNHTMVMDDSCWAIPGLHFSSKDRIASSSGALQRMGIDLLFVNQVEEMNLSGDETGATKFVVKCGKNDAAKTTGERAAQQMKFVLDKLADIGVHLIS